MGNKCSKEKSEVVSSVEEFNSISKLLNLPLTSAECILAGNFPWSFGEQQINSQGTRYLKHNLYLTLKFPSYAVY